jgi:hypothetical protein
MSRLYNQYGQTFKKLKAARGDLYGCPSQFLNKVYVAFKKTHRDQHVHNDKE